MVMRSILRDIWLSLGGDLLYCDRLDVTGEGALPSAFAISDFATASIGSAALALAEFTHVQNVSVDRRLSTFWFAKSIRPMGWSLPPQWDPIAGNYPALDGWVRLHTNAASHRDACLRVLGCRPNPDEVRARVAHWKAFDLQEAVVAAGGVASQMLHCQDWLEHPQGRAVTSEPLIDIHLKDGPLLRPVGTPERPLAGLRVLDLTRILAGPIATRFLAGFGADVLRIDPPGWEEPAVLPEVTPGKTRARLDLRDPNHLQIFHSLLKQADVLVHGLRADALDRLGLGHESRQKLNPDLIDISLNAYGWFGPWASRRGFDTIVQMSTGLVATEMDVAGASSPQNLPVQALDYGTGHMMAACVLRALSQARTDGRRTQARLSLARTAALLSQYTENPQTTLATQDESDLSSRIETTYWGQAQRLLAPFIVGEYDFHWSRMAGPLGDGEPAFAP